MSRSGYSEDGEEDFPNAFSLYSANVDRAYKGKRGQRFLEDLLAALDAMPVKRLISDELQYEGDFCALGVLGQAKGIDVKPLDPENAKQVSKVFNIAECLAREIVFMNDEAGWDYKTAREETPEQRWVRMRNWVASQIKESQS